MSYGIPGSSFGASDLPDVPLEQPTSLFRYGEQALWSTQMHVGTTVLANSTHRLFATQLGRVGQGFVQALTIAETNVKEAGRIPNGVAFDCFGVAGQVYKADAAADGGDVTTAINNAADVDELINIQYNAALAWDFTQTQVDIAPFDLCGAGGGAFGAVATTNNAVNHGAMNNGNGGIWMYRKHPVALPGSSTFAVEVQFGARAAAIATATAVRVVLLGYYKSVIEIGN